jgi:hypothetical protein
MATNPADDNGDTEEEGDFVTQLGVSVGGGVGALWALGHQGNARVGGPGVQPTAKAHLAVKSVIQAVLRGKHHVSTPRADLGQLVHTILPPRNTSIRTASVKPRHRETPAPAPPKSTNDGIKPEERGWGRARMHSTQGLRVMQGGRLACQWEPGVGFLTCGSTGPTFKVLQVGPTQPALHTQLLATHTPFKLQSTSWTHAVAVPASARARSRKRIMWDKSQTQKERRSQDPGLTTIRIIAHKHFWGVAMESAGQPALGNVRVGVFM